MCVGYMHFCFKASKRDLHDHTHTHTHIWQANLMFAFRQIAVVGVSRSSGSSFPERELGITSSSHMPLSTIAMASVVKTWNLFGSRRHLSLVTFFDLRPETLSMYRREFPEHVSANKSIFACSCWLCSSNRQVAVCTFRSKADSVGLVSWNGSLSFCQISCARTFCYIDCKCNVRHPEAILLHLCKVSIRFFDCGADHVSTFAFRS